MPKDNPSEIAEHLAQANGLEGAIQVVRDGIDKAHQDNDNYRLSVWREVRQKLILMESKAVSGWRGMTSDRQSLPKLNEARRHVTESRS